MSRKKLILSFEVVDKAPAQHNLDTRLVEPFLVDAESLLCRNECFGDEFYQDLIDKLRPAEEYDDCKQYLTGAVVVYGSTYYVAIIDPAPGTEPTDSAAWNVTTKFTESKYDDLWCNYLCDYMTFSVLHAMLMTGAIQISTIGVTRGSTDFNEAAEKDELLLLKNDLQNKKETRFLMMHKFMTRVNENLGIDNESIYVLYPPNIEKSCGDNCGKKRKSSINIPFPKSRRHDHNINNHNHH